MPTFDVVSELDMQEVRNAVDQASREVSTRYDFKNTGSSIELGEKTIEAYPNIVFTVRTNRAFLARSVTYLARDAGVRQFLDIGTGQVSEMVRRLNESVAEKVTTRDHDGVVRLFDGLELVPPGVVRAPQWRPESELAEASPAALWAGVGRKP